MRVLEDLLTSVRSGKGGALVLRGEPGIGKTALLDRVAEEAVGFTVVRTVGNEAEMELPYAGLQDLLRRSVGEVRDLPDPQRRAVDVALGRTDGDTPDQLLVGLGLLNLLSASRSNGPLLCVVDDAQWLDVASAQAIAFAARHVAHDAVGFLFGARQGANEIRGLPELVILGLGDQDAHELLARTVPDRLDDPVADRLVAETRGNPLALLELPRGLSPAELAGGFGLPGPVVLSDRIEESYRRRLARLPLNSAKLLLISAAEPTGDSVVIWRAAEKLGITEDAADALEADGFVHFGARVIFDHPLVRSAVYGTSTPKERREAHRLLAEATDAAVDPDRRAWHRAQATVRPNESVAAELDASAARAQARGGFAAAAAFLERSVTLTRDPARRASRALRAAQAKRQAGALDAASALAGIAENGPLSDLERAHVDALMGQIAFARRRGNEVAPRLLKAAAQLERVDSRLAQDAYLDALIAAIFAGHLAADANPQQVARAVRAAPQPDQSARPS
jgi:AAA ATPase domain